MCYVGIRRIPVRAPWLTRPARTQGIFCGVVLIVASTAFFALAGIFTKATSADPWTIACWRGLVGALASAPTSMSGATARRRQRAFGWVGAAGRLPSSARSPSIAFIAAFKYTYVANVAVIYATVPFMAAAIEWLALGKRTRRADDGDRGGIAGRRRDHRCGQSRRRPSVRRRAGGLMTFGCAVYLVMIRAYAGTPVVWAAAVSSLMLFLAGWFVADPLAISATTSW